MKTYGYIENSDNICKYYIQIAVSAWKKITYWKTTCKNCKDRIKECLCQNFQKL
jgi:hypothetical protein